LRSAPNAIGEYLGNRLDTGSLINDKVTEAMFTMYVHTVLDDNKYMLLDGFPRNIKQLQELTSAAKEHGRTLHGIWFTLDRETATTRMLRRGRADDTTSSI
jgi:adenylate kinase family enzyme